MLQAADVLADKNEEAAYQLKYAEAYRACKATDAPYVGVLASASGLVGLKISVPTFPAIRPLQSASIVIAPFPIEQEMALPETVWRAVLHLLRSYGLRIYLLGNRGQWQDCCAFTEDEILSEHSVAEKLSILAGAELVVGLPNEWLWSATAWTKKITYWYPDNVSPKRWFPYAHQSYGRMVYAANQIQIPVIINQLRLLIGQL
jgi:hypothetical protein